MTTKEETNWHQQLEYFPKDIKLSYENVVYKKVSNADIMMAIPEGKKCYLWFTTYKEKNVCYLLELNEDTPSVDSKSQNKWCKKIYPVLSCYDTELCYESVFYGTVFHHNKSRFFTIEDILYYKSNNMSQMNYGNKLKMMVQIFETEISQIAYNDAFLIIGLPLISRDFSQLMNNISQLQYGVKYIQFRYFESRYINNLKYIKPSSFELRSYDNKQLATNRYKNNGNFKTELVFKVKAELQNDIYNLYCYHNGNLDYYYGIALIPDYKTSVMMNKLFRKIKENVNLDYLEESDSEEEFENENIDKFVNLEKSYNMVCKYNQKFNKWVPVKLALRGDRLANYAKDLVQVKG